MNAEPPCAPEHDESSVQVCHDVDRPVPVARRRSAIDQGSLGKQPDDVSFRRVLSGQAWNDYPAASDVLNLRKPGAFSSQLLDQRGRRLGRSAAGFETEAISNRVHDTFVRVRRIFGTRRVAEDPSQSAFVPK